MKVLKSRTIKSGFSKGEKIKLKELNQKDMSKLNVNSKYVITIGEYGDVDWEEDNLDACINFYNDYENN